MTALALTRVSKQRGEGPRAVRALHDLSLHVREGELVLLEGPSGVGKTTLLAVAAGLLTADEGEIVLAGVDLSRLSPAERRRHRARNVGFVFQRSNLLDGLSARDNILLMAALADVAPTRAAGECDRLLEQLGLVGVADRRPGTLSGGEEQRVAVARALVHRPAVVLADEPTGNLDTAAGRAVAESLSSLAGSRDAAVVVATHDERLAPYADRRLHMIDGEIREREAVP